MVACESVCLRRLGGTRSGEVQASRFFANPKVTAGRIIDSWHEQTAAAVTGRHVLAIQDTTAVTFATGQGRYARGGGLRRGLGALNHGNAHGVLAHVMMAVDADSRACLGLAGGAIWNREGLVTSPEWKRPLSQRESRRWVETAEQARPVLAAAEMVTVITDREGDMYALWARVPGPGWHVLSRVRRPSMRPQADAFVPAGRRTLMLPARPPEQAARQAELEVRFGAVTITRSPNEKDRSLVMSVRLTLLDVREVTPRAGVEPVHWQLLTTHRVAAAEQAWRIVGWYQARWCVEQLFRILKSQGLRLEDSQVAAAERLMKLSAAAIKAAGLVLQLVQERDGAHGLPAACGFSDAETDTLEALIPTLEGRTERQRNPHKVGTLARASWAIARLGGWNGYYKPPGPITMHRGIERFHAMHQGRLLALNQQRFV